MPDKRRLFIVGASNFGREVESWLELIPNSQRDWHIAGYLDKDADALAGHPSDYRVVGDEDAFQFVSSDLVVMGVTEPSIKEKIYNKLKGKVKFFTLVSPNAVIAKFAKIGEGSIICPNSLIAVNASIGSLVTVNCGSQIGHDAVVGDFSSIMSNVDIGGKCQLGKKVFMGTGALIIPGKTVCDNVKIGTGSVVLRNIKSAVSVFGVPAKEI